MIKIEGEIAELKRRVATLESYREKDKDELHHLDNSLQKFIVEMKNISEDLKTIVSNSKEAVMRSTTATQKDITLLKEENDKLEKEITELKKEFEKETVVANAKKWKNFVSYIATAILAAVVALVLSQIGLT